MARDDAPLDEALVADPDVPAAYLLSTSEPPLGDSAAAASDGADPPRTSFHEDPPAAAASTADEAPTLRRARRSWIALLAVLALALASFLLWRSRQAEPARALPPPAAPSATPRQAADTLGGRPTGADSAATSTFADSSAAAVTPIDDALATPPPLPEPAAPQPGGRPTPGAAAPTVRAAPPVAARQPGDSRGLPPDLRLAILPVRIAGLPPADAQALAGGVVRPSSGAFTWVVLSTPARADADALAERYRTAGYRTGVLTASQRGGAVFRVVVGAFDSREQAFRLRDRLPPQAPPDTWPLDLRAL